MGRSVTFTDAGINADGIEDASCSEIDLEPEAEAIPGCSGFEGPRFHFSLLLGEGRVWRGEWGAVKETADGRYACDFCGGEVSVRAAARSDDGRERWHVTPAGPHPALEPFVYCLGCQRSGKDAVIQRASLVAPPRKSYAPDPALRGGTG